MDISPPEPLNFAAHLFQANAGRAAKIAYVDDRGSLSYGELEQRSRRLAAGLLGLGLRREERVLLLMLDSNEWPVAFLGCLYAGIVPVAVERFCEVTGARASEVILQISPCIRPPNYETDFASEIADQAKRLGVGQIFDCGICTASHPSRYYSYRRERGQTGRMLALLALVP